MEFTTIEDRYLELAENKVELIRNNNVIVELNYVYDPIVEIHRFEVYYVPKNLWR